MGQTIAEKILSRVVGRRVKVGEIIFPAPDLVTVHDWYIRECARALADFGVEKIRDPQKLLVCTDHEPVATSERASERQKTVRDIVGQFGIKLFFDVGRGGHGHMFPMEMGIVRPGMFVLGYDTHVTNYGAVGCLGIALVTEITEVLACGSAWIRVPPTVRVNVSGRLKRGVSMRDVAQRMISDISPEVADYAVLEFGGEGSSGLSFGERVTLCNTPVEIGAKSAVVECDVKDLAAMGLPSRTDDVDMKGDGDGEYSKILGIDLGSHEPQVAVPPRPDLVVNVSEVAGTRIDHAFVGSCANCSIDDLRAAASILRGRRLHSRVRMFVTPGTQKIAAQAATEGLIATFVEAGAILTAPGCGPCAAGYVGNLGPGETSINTGTRNDPGRLGARNASIYLASPLTVAASAVKGAITDAREFLSQDLEP